MALENDQAEMESLEDSLGFTKVIQKITESGKLVVGHNMLLDVAFTLNQFAAPLPTDYHVFKVILNQSISSNLTNVQCTLYNQALAATGLPRVMDTKLMANTAPLRQ